MDNAALAFTIFVVGIGLFLLVLQTHSPVVTNLSQRCPECMKWVHKDATKCPYCAHEFVMDDGNTPSV